MAQHIVYRYIDAYDGVVKYVGITQRKLSQRINEHIKNDSWTKLHTWRIEYFYVNTKSESEAWESHLIALYKTYNWYNIAKNKWGLIQQFKDVYPMWRVYSIADDIVDIKYENLPVLPLDNIDGLITDMQLKLDYDISQDYILLMVSKKIIQPLARTPQNNLLFIETDNQKVYDYLHTF